MSETTDRPLLVVDDEAPVLKLITRVLVRAKYEVLSALDGESALTMAEGQPLAAAIIDITLPGIDGGEVARRLRETHPGLPVLLTSGYDEATAKSKVKGLSDVAFLQKPFTPATLTETIAGLL